MGQIDATALHLGNKYHPLFTLDITRIPSNLGKRFGTFDSVVARRRIDRSAFLQLATSVLASWSNSAIDHSRVVEEETQIRTRNCSLQRCVDKPLGHRREIRVETIPHAIQCPCSTRHSKPIVAGVHGHPLAIQ